MSTVPQPVTSCDVFGYQTVFGFDFWHFTDKFIFLEESVYCIDHVLGKFYFRVSETMFVGDVVRVIDMTSRFSSSSTWLNS